MHGDLYFAKVQIPTSALYVVVLGTLRTLIDALLLCYHI